jgi:hypothetical protein
MAARPDIETEYYRLMGIPGYTHERAISELISPDLIPESRESGGAADAPRADPLKPRPIDVSRVSAGLISPIGVLDYSKYPDIYKITRENIELLKIFRDAYRAAPPESKAAALKEFLDFNENTGNVYNLNVYDRYGIQHREIPEVNIDPDYLATGDESTHILGVPNKEGSTIPDHNIAIIEHPDRIEFYDPAGKSISLYPRSVQQYMLDMSARLGKPIVYNDDRVQCSLPSCQAYSLLRTIHPEMNAIQFNKAVRDGAHAVGMDTDEFVMFKMHQLQLDEVKSQAIPHFKHGGLIKAGRKYHH